MNTISYPSSIDYPQEDNKEYYLCMINIGKTTHEEFIIRDDDINIFLPLTEDEYKYFNDRKVFVEWNRLTKLSSICSECSFCPETNSFENAETLLDFNRFLKLKSLVGKIDSKIAIPMRETYSEYLKLAEYISNYTIEKIINLPVEDVCVSNKLQDLEIFQCDINDAIDLLKTFIYKIKHWDDSRLISNYDTEYAYSYFNYTFCYLYYGILRLHTFLDQSIDDTKTVRKVKRLLSFMFAYINKFKILSLIYTKCNDNFKASLFMKQHHLCNTMLNVFKEEYILCDNIKIIIESNLYKVTVRKDATSSYYTEIDDGSN